jgi:acyl dehydratase
MTAEADPTYDASVIGVEVETGRFVVEAAQIRAFCEATGETNPLYTDPEVAAAGPHGAIIAPPAFYGAMRLSQGLDPKLVFGNVTFHAGQRCEFHEPLRAGDTIIARTKVHEIYEKTGRTGRMVFLVRRTTYSNQDEKTVALVDNSMVYRNVER